MCCKLPKRQRPKLRLKLLDALAQLAQPRSGPPRPAAAPAPRVLRPAPVPARSPVCGSRRSRGRLPLPAPVQLLDREVFVVAFDHPAFDPCEDIIYSCCSSCSAGANSLRSRRDVVVID